MTIVFFILSIALFCVNTNHSSKNLSVISADPIPYDLTLKSYDEKITYYRQNKLRRANGIHYFDYAEEPLFPDTITQEFSDNLHKNLYGNPHSESPSSHFATTVISDLRRYLLKFLGDKFNNYTIVFSYSNAQSLKFIAEDTTFTKNSTFYYPEFSSGDILGMRQLAAVRGAKSEIYKIPNQNDNIPFIPYPNDRNMSLDLITIPLVNEFDGTVLPDEQIDRIIHQKRDRLALVTADASLYMQTHKLNLERFPFHIVTFSFKKLFGFPNIAAMAIHNSMVKLPNVALVKPYFGGGSLVYALTKSATLKYRITPNDRYEDGSPPFIHQASIPIAFKEFDKLGFDNIHEHIKSLTATLRQRLSDLRRSLGQPVCEIYGTNSNSSIVSFNILDNNGQRIDYQSVIEKASQKGLYLSGGCFVPASCRAVFHINEEAAQEAISQGKPVERVGAIRVSLGWASNEDDINALVAFIKSEYGQ